MPVKKKRVRKADQLIWSNEHQSWWAPNSRGYTCDPRKAGRYTKSEARDIVIGAGFGYNNMIPNEIMVAAGDARIYYKGEL